MWGFGPIKLNRHALNTEVEVVVLDNLPYRHPELVKDVLKVKLIVRDISDRYLLEHGFSNAKIPN
ncbi:MAG: hypothetical protein AB4038_01305 [Prochloraceae cyanobacterium]